MVDQYVKYAQGLNAREEVITWINQTLAVYLKKLSDKGISYVTQGVIEHILDYLVSDAAPKRLLKMSIKQAQEGADKWSKANQKKGRGLVDEAEDLNVLHNYSDGSRIVKLVTKKAYQREGTLMGHCVGGYSVTSEIEIYSYRDAKNQPHATFEVQRRGGEVSQIKGKGNGPIHPKYIMPILDFLEAIGQKPRPSEMQNLGYYHVDKNFHEFVKSLTGYEKQLTMIHGELYAHP